MPAKEEKALTTPTWLAEPLKTALADLRNRLGRQYRFKIENQTERSMDGTYSISMRNSGSRKAKINSVINSFEGGYIQHRWLRKLDLSVVREFEMIKTLPQTRYHKLDLCNTLQGLLKAAVKSLLKDHNYVLISAQVEFNTLGDGGCRTKVMLQHRDRSTSDGEQIMCTTVRINYYSEGWL